MLTHVPKAVIRAAEARAMGMSWTSAAAAAGWPLKDLEGFIRRHRRTWMAELGRARHATRESAGDEAVSMLRKHLRSEEVKIVVQVASVLARQFAQEKRRGRKSGGTTAPPQILELLNQVPEGQTTRVDQHLDACDDEERAAPAPADASAG